MVDGCVRADMIDRRSARAALQTALTDAIARDFSDALRIHHYVDALPGWAPTPGYCHDQVDRWLRSHPGDTPVRGWITDVCFDCNIRFAAHSLVRTAAGELLDVTYTAPGCPQYFIAHPAAAGEFFALVRGEPPLPFVVVPRPDRS